MSLRCETSALQKYHLPLSDKDVSRVLDLQRHKRVWVYDLDDEDDEDGVISSANTSFLDLLIWFQSKLLHVWFNITNKGRYV